MSYFKEEENDLFKAYFRKELYSKMKFVQEEDHDDFFDPEAAYGRHITATQEKLYILINNSILEKDNTLSSEEVIKIFTETRENLFKTLMPEIESYIEQIEVDYK